MRQCCDDISGRSVHIRTDWRSGCDVYCCRSCGTIWVAGGRGHDPSPMMGYPKIANMAEVEAYRTGGLQGLLAAQAHGVQGDPL